ncbi:AfsR/SARP family transcriptional regulator [Nonomuraea sp. PA05]|uniref:AfsR/SARP family transcriptional regulator n=1 Tax=Nonomuraea sp. PA05 TaxID=2604466 RepID=UPI0021CCAD1D|nr:BTAD domain-containing putative transcriptional regulator [Nonomuraea sp. PA05]
MGELPAFGVLGPLQVLTPDRSLRIGGTKPRLLLATLLLEANQVVGSDTLIEVLWPAGPPSSATANLRTYVSSLRGVLGTAGARIAAHPSGYAIEVPVERLDLLLFEDLVARARADGRTEAGAAHLREALALWRGEPLGDLPASPAWDHRLRALTQARLAAAEELVATKLATGEHASAIDDLRGLIGEHPYREDLWQQLILALHRGGRRAEALHAYTEIRRQLVDELGIEPGQELREAHARVLAEDAGTGVGVGVGASAQAAPGADTDAGEDTNAGVRTGAPPPYQLPADIPDFTGRATAVTELTEALGTHHPDGPPSIAVVVGPPGVGKTALAVHCAHAVRPGYPAGQLHLCLGGTDPSPADPAELLAEALRALGVAAAALPPTLRERSALYRSLLAERPMLVFLDDAADTAQVRALLPGNGCAVLITSRRRITELPGALLLELDVLPPGEAERLLGRIIGPERLAADRQAALDILASCGHLPLAIRIAGARLAGRPGWPLAVFQRRLADESSRLDELRAGDLEVRGSLERSTGRLTGEAATAFHALGLLGPASVPGWVADAVLGRPRTEAVVDSLVDASLLRLAGTDALGQPRYQLHGLMRAQARQHVEGEEGRRALARVVGGWTSAAGHAMTRLPTTLFSLTPEEPVSWSLPGETLAQLTADPLSWFEAERESLVEAVRLAAGTGLSASAWGLAGALVPYFDLHCLLDEWQLTHSLALDSARAAGDRRGEAAMLRGLGQVCLYQDRYTEAGDMLRRACALFRELGDTRGEAISICGLGAVSQFSGDHLRALGSFRRALAMFLTIGDRGGEAYARQAIGRVHLSLRDVRQASRWLAEALRLARDLGDTHREGCVSMHLGRLHDMRAEAGEAMRFQGRALDIFERLGDRHCGAYAMQSLGGLQAANGERSEGSDRLQASLAIFQQLGDRSGEAAAFQTLGELYRSAGRTALASHYLHRAVELRRELHDADPSPRRV